MHKFKRSHNFSYRNRQEERKTKIRRNPRKKKKNIKTRRTREKEEEKIPISYRSMNACCYFCCNFCLLRRILSLWNFFTLIFSIRFTFDPLVFLFNLKFVEWLVGRPVKWKCWWIFKRRGFNGKDGWELKMFVQNWECFNFLKLYKIRHFLINRNNPPPHHLLCSTSPYKASPTKCQEK